MQEISDRLLMRYMAHRCKIFATYNLGVTSMSLPEVRI
jgi:hypothetical protein